MTEKQYEGIEHVIELINGKESSCPFCPPYTLRGNLAENINHFITQHGYRILHIGTDTKQASTDGSPWHCTIALLGK